MINQLKDFNLIYFHITNIHIEADTIDIPHNEYFILHIHKLYATLDEALIV